jgi:hypothetical protein
MLQAPVFPILADPNTVMCRSPSRQGEIDRLAFGTTTDEGRCRPLPEAQPRPMAAFSKP